MIQFAKLTFGKETDKTGAVGRAPQVEVSRKSLIRPTFGSRHLVKSPVSFNGLWPERLRHFAKDVGKTVLGRRLALLGPVGQRAPAPDVHPLERSREVWAAWRAPFLPHTEGVGGGFKRGVAKSLRLCGNAQGVCADWFAPFGSRR